jgi:hypothetical protein
LSAISVRREPHPSHPPIHPPVLISRIFSPAPGPLFLTSYFPQAPSPPPTHSEEALSPLRLSSHGVGWGREGATFSARGWIDHGFEFESDPGTHESRTVGLRVT